MKQVPILILSDDPSQNSGLARITRDLATVLCTMPEFRVATLGLGGTGSDRLPWTQYHMFPGEFGELSLPAVWDEFSHGDVGVVMTIWDLTRILWLARPEYCEVLQTQQWLQGARAKKFMLWGYLPIDAAGPGNQLTGQNRECLLGIDRVLAYTPWAEGLVRNTIGDEQSVRKGLTWMPHGINMGTFKPDENAPKGDVPLIGVVATNQARKDWGLMAEVANGLVAKLEGKVKFWWHTDALMRYWNLPALIEDFGLSQHVEVTSHTMTDREMAARYRACTLTLHPGLGEGFGYPIFESLACGTPAIHGDYGGGASIMHTCDLSDWLVPFSEIRLDGPYNCVRPVFVADHWIGMVHNAIVAGRVSGPSRVEHLSWKKLSPTWKKWFRDGLGEVELDDHV